MTLENPSRISANTEKATGVTKENLGKMTGNHRMQADGQVKQDHADAEYKAAQHHDKKEGTHNKLVGKAQELKGKVTGNDSKRVEGKANQEEGRVQKNASHY